MKFTSQAEALRTAAGILADHPDLPGHPYVTSNSYRDGTSGVDIQWYVQLDDQDGGEQKRIAQTILRAIGGHWNKDMRDETAQFTQQVQGVKLIVQVERAAVCERIVKGVRTVTIPAKNEPARTIEVEDVEWRCEPVMADVLVHA